MRNSDVKTRVFLLRGMLATVVIGCGEAPPPVPAVPPKVTVAHPEVRELTDFDEYNGWTAAAETVEVRSRVRGHIVKVNFTDGQNIEAGTPLFELDPEPFNAEVGKAQGQLAIAQAQLDQAQKEEARQKLLFDKGAGTIQDYEVSQAVRKTWEAQVAAADQEVKRAELDAKYARITAPIGGRVSRAMLTQGNLVNAGGLDPVLTTIVATDPIHIYFSVDERSLIRYRERRSAASDGTPAKTLDEAQVPFEFGLDTDEGFPHQGMLDFADNQIDTSTGTVEVRGRTANPNAVFIPGSRVRVRVAVSEPYNGILVPDTAILTDQSRKYVLALNAENVVLRRDIRPGRLLDDGMRVVLPPAGGTEELTAEDRIIVLGLQRARINYAVEPVDTEGQSAAD